MATLTSPSTTMRNHLSTLAMNVSEIEGKVLYTSIQYSANIVEDDDLIRLITIPNITITGHQALFTKEV
jgi:D-lactate dehydrogenase